MEPFFQAGERGYGPAITDALVEDAERRLGVRLPRAYVELLRECNGGRPRRRCYPTRHRTSWGDRIQVSTLLGLGYPDGVDGIYGSEYMAREWGYPEVGPLVFDTPSGGHDAVLLDYTECGRGGEPRVVHVDDNRIAIPVVDSFADFVAGLVLC